MTPYVDLSILKGVEVIMSEDEKVFSPAFLSQERAEACEYPGADDVPTFDLEIPDITAQGLAELEKTVDGVPKPVAGVINRYREVARLHVLGKTNNFICKYLGYTAPRVSIILRHPYTQYEIMRLRSQIFDRDTVETLKEASRDGAKYVHSVILDESEATKYRLDAAKWAKEQAYGKAHQSHTVENNTLNVYIDMMKDMKNRGEILDVSPLSSETSKDGSSEDLTEKPESLNGKWDSWLDDNLE